MTKVLTIAGFDPSGGAGVQADLRVFRAFGEYGLSVVAALTAQNSRAVSSVLPVEATFVRKQLAVLLCDLMPEAVKIGMLYTKENILTVASIIRKFSLVNVVLDPVLLSSSGKRLAESGAPKILRDRLLPFCSVVTPNIHEASVLTGVRITGEDDMKKAAALLREYGCENVIVTGGHLEKAATDLFYDGSYRYIRSRKIAGEFHGTGCVFSSAVAAGLAKGKTPLEAAKAAKRFMIGAFNRSVAAGAGMKLFDI